MSFAAACPRLADRTVTVNGVSKAYAMTGWRIGFAVGNERLIEALTRVKSYLDYGAFTPIQVAAAAEESINVNKNGVDTTTIDVKNLRGRADRFLNDKHGNVHNYADENEKKENQNYHDGRDLQPATTFDVNNVKCNNIPYSKLRLHISITQDIFAFKASLKGNDTQRQYPATYAHSFAVNLLCQI